ncbi:MAG: hypothetical protein WCK67_07405 [bacterium]
MITLNRNTNVNILTKNVKSKEVLINNKTENKAQLSNNGLIDSKTSIAARNLSINYINLKSSKKDVNTIHNVESNKISFKGEKQVRESLKVIEKALIYSRMSESSLIPPGLGPALKYQTISELFNKITKIYNTEGSFSSNLIDSLLLLDPIFVEFSALAVLGFCEMKEQDDKKINLDDFKNSDFSKYHEYGKELKEKFKNKQ